MKKSLLFIFLFIFLPLSVDAADYFIDQNSSAGCSDDFVGSEDQPWCTIGKAATTVVAGDNINVKAGTYEGGVFFRYPHGGTAENRINLRALEGDHVVIDGQNTHSHALRIGVSYMTIEGFEVINTLSHGILVGWSEGASEEVKILNNEVHDCGGTNKDTAAVYYAGGFGGLIEGNHLYNNSGDGITIVSDDIIIRDNHIHHNEVDGIKGGGGGTVIIENNHIHDMTNAANHGDCLQMMGMTETVIIRNNTVYDCTQDIYLDDYSPELGGRPWGDSYIYNNLVYNTKWIDGSDSGYYNGIVGGSRYNNWNSNHIYNNTIVDLNNGSGGISTGSNADGTYNIAKIRIHNNILYNSINNVKPTLVSSYGTDISMDNNLYYNDQRSWYFGETWTNLEGFRENNPGYEENSIYEQIEFVNYDYSDPDFHIKDGMQAVIDRAKTIAAQGDIDFSLDKDAVSRASGNAWDIGAYEYEQAFVTTEIRADVNQDESIDSSDARLVLRKILGFSMTGTNWQASDTTGDVDCNGEVNLQDSLLLLKKLLNMDMSDTAWCE